ncbi:hypothetical protein [Nocardia sp. NPDC004750]
MPTHPDTLQADHARASRGQADLTNTAHANPSPDTPPPYEDDDADTDAFESTLAAYLTNPTWQATHRA